MTLTDLKMQMLPFAAATMVAAMAFVSTGCKDDAPMGTSSVDPNTTPTMMTLNVKTLISDSGVVRYQLTSPIWYVYDESEDPYWYFPKGIEMLKFDNFFRTDATVTADSAKYFKKQQIWRLDGNVTIQNVLNERFLTEQLFWDQRRHKLYSDSFIHIERSDRVLEGYGFDSNEQLTVYEINKVSGIFPAAAIRRNGQAGAPSPADSTTTDSISKK